MAHAQGLAVLPYFALANGFLGAACGGAPMPGTTPAASGRPRHLSRRGHRVLAALDEIAFAHGVQPATIALAWLLAKPTVVAPVVSATTARPGRGAHRRGIRRTAALRDSSNSTARRPDATRRAAPGAATYPAGARPVA